MTEVPIGHVGVVISYVGKAHEDVSGPDFKHGDLVTPGHKGVWVDAALPRQAPAQHAGDEGGAGAHHQHRAELGEPHRGAQLRRASCPRSPCARRTASPSTWTSRRSSTSARLDAPKVISRVGSMQNLVDHVLQPIVGNYFRNAAQAYTVLDFLGARSERQAEAADAHPRAPSAPTTCRPSTRSSATSTPPDELMRDADRPQDRGGAEEDLRGAGGRAEAAPAAGARDGDRRDPAGAGAAPSRACASRSCRRPRACSEAGRRGGGHPRDRRGARPTPIARAWPPWARQASPRCRSCRSWASAAVRIVPDVAVSGDASGNGLVSALLGNLVRNQQAPPAA